MNDESKSTLDPARGPSGALPTGAPPKPRLDDRAATRPRAFWLALDWRLPQEEFALA